jgi:hypothetical protein
MPAKFRVRIARAAERDIEETWNFIAYDSAEAPQIRPATGRTNRNPGEVPGKVPAYSGERDTWNPLSPPALRELPDRVSHREKHSLRHQSHPQRSALGQLNV